MRRLLLAAMLLLLGALISSPRAAASTCVLPEHQWPNLDVVVRARLVAIPEPGLARLEISRYYKGSGPRLLQANIAGIGSMHRMDWQQVPRVGDELLIGLHRDQDQLRNDLCTLLMTTEQENRWGPELQALLGAGQAPHDAIPPAPRAVQLLLPAVSLLILMTVLARFRDTLSRAIQWAGGLLALDQLTKLLAAATLGEGRHVLLAPDLGLTYVLNPGIWVRQSLAPAYMPWLQVLTLLCCALLTLYLAHYHEHYRRSRWLDLALAFFMAAALGNMVLDRFLAGGARDFLWTPIAVANLADLYASAALIALALEPVTFPPARRLLISPRAWLEDQRRFTGFLRRSLRWR